MYQEENPSNPVINNPDSGLSIKTTIPRADLEILVYGVHQEQDSDNSKNSEHNKTPNDKMLKALHNQINTCPDGAGIRVLYYIDKGEKTDEEKIQWLMENKKCHFYVLVDNRAYPPAPDFVKKSIAAVVRYFKAFQHLRKRAIVKVPTPKPEPMISSALTNLEEVKDIMESNEQ